MGPEEKKERYRDQLGDKNTSKRQSKIRKEGSFIVSDDLCSMLAPNVVFYVLDLLLNAERRNDLHQTSSLATTGFSFLVRPLDPDAPGTC